MKRKLSFALLASILILFSSGYAVAQSKIDAIVSPAWLAKNAASIKNLVILDVRDADSYKAGHMPNAVSKPFTVPDGVWATRKAGLNQEIPDDAELFKTIGSCGITTDSVVVVVTSPSPPPLPPLFFLASAPRVAATLFYAGVRNVAILDGGFAKWEAENLPVTTDVPQVKAVEFKGNPYKPMQVNKAFVKQHLKDMLIIDTREAEYYFGVTPEPLTGKLGHIPYSKSMPVPWFYNADGTFKDTETLRNLVSKVVPKGKDVIAYCGGGGYTPILWFVLTQVLGYSYENVRLYDPSMQEWTKTGEEAVVYQWWD